VKIEITSAIREVLDDMNAVTINGLGTLSLKHQSAHFINKGETLSPPQMELQFSSNIDTNSALIKKIVENFKISKSKAQEVVNVFSQKVLNAYVNYGQVNLSGIGTLKKTDLGKVGFKPSDSFVGSYYKDYPEIPISRISKSIEKKSIKELPIQRPLKPEVKKVASTNGTINEKIKNDLVEPSVIKPQTKAVEKPKPIASTVVKPQSKVQPIQKPAPVVYNEPKRSWLWPFLYLIGLLLFLLLCFKTCNAIYNYNSGNKGAVKEESIENQSNILEGVVAEDSTAQEFLDSQNLNNENGIVLPASGMCKIITGVFARQINIERRSELITREGYNLYTEPFGPYTRVGMQFNCDESTGLEEYLQNVRSEIDPFSWYLDPSLYVEYQ